MKEAYQKSEIDWCKVTASDNNIERSNLNVHLLAGDPQKVECLQSQVTAWGPGLTAVPVTASCSAERLEVMNRGHTLLQSELDVLYAAKR